MSSPVSQPNAQYFLGVEGEQSGPFSEAEILQKIVSRSVTDDTLIWCEGMAEWAPITSVQVFERALTEPTSIDQQIATAAPEEAIPSPIPEPIQKPQAIRHEVKQVSDEATPVFDTDEGRFTESPFVRFRMVFIGVGIAVLVSLSLAYFYFDSVTSETYTKASSFKGPSKIPLDKRGQALAKATSEILLDPTNSIKTLNSLIQENPSDKFSTEAIQTLTDYYRSNQKPQEAAQVYMMAKRPGEAAKILLADPGLKAEAEVALFAAYEAATDAKEKKEFLLQNIALLVGELKQVDKGTERVKLFESTFPGESHPYKYYVRSVDERIADIFPRISFHFVQALLSYVETEFPSITFLERPLVEVKKNKLGEYRLTGSYRGDVLLNKDSLKDISFVFWMHDDRWVLVDTNLTKERRQWAQTEREKLKNISKSAAAILKYLETVFQTQFPRSALHESISVDSVSRKKRPDDGF